MSTPFFRFRKFTVWHDRCAMKVGTDGVLLGAWTGVTGFQHNAGLRVLDIGTGSGVVALMTAQRLAETGRTESDTRIDAIDIDGEAAEQAADNFAKSPWAQMLNSEHISFAEFCEREHEKYQLIVSNPPFFSRSLQCPDARRTSARHTATLDHETLLRGVAGLLAEEGVAAFITPTESEQSFLDAAEKAGLRAVRMRRVQGQKDKPAKRLLVEFRHRMADTQGGGETADCVTEPELALSDRDMPRTEEYAALTAEFYL